MFFLRAKVHFLFETGKSFLRKVSKKIWWGLHGIRSFIKEMSEQGAL